MIASALHSFHFLRPAWLLALPLLLGLGWWLARQHARDGDWGRLIDAELLPSLRLDETSIRSSSPWRWLNLAWSIAVLALAGPSWQHDEAPAFRSPAAWVILLDLSPSMSATDVSPDRAARARYLIEDLLGAAHDARVGLVVFGDEAYTVTPLTQDVATIRSLLSPLTPQIMPSRGDHLAPALDAAAKLLSSSATHKRKVIVLTDGFDDPAAAFTAAGRLRAQGSEVDVIGIGTSGGAPVSKPDGGFEQDAQGQPALAQLDASALKQLARSGGGNYSDLAASSSLISGLKSATGLPEQAESAGDDIKVEHWRDAGAWLLPFVLLSAAVLARRGWL